MLTHKGRPLSLVALQMEKINTQSLKSVQCPPRYFISFAATQLSTNPSSASHSSKLPPLESRPYRYLTSVHLDLVSLQKAIPSLINLCSNCGNHKLYSLCNRYLHLSGQGCNRHDMLEPLDQPGLWYPSVQSVWVKILEQKWSQVRSDCFKG